MKLSRLFVGILLTTLATFSAAENDFLVSQNFGDVIDTVTSLKKDYAANDIMTLVDIDFTVTVPNHAATHFPNFSTHYDALEQLTQDVGRPLQERVENLSLMSHDQLLIDDSIPNHITWLQNQSVKTTAITAMLCGKLLPEKDKVPAWRYQTLKDLKIDFSQSFPHFSNEILFTDIEKYNDSHPTYYRGILCTNGESGGHNKGTVLDAFLKKIQYKPKVIVMIDDRIQNLRDVKSTLEQLYPDTKFIGIDYQKGRSVSHGTLSRQAFIDYWQSIRNKL